MCGGGPDVDKTPQKMQRDTAEEARAREEARQARIEQGRSFLDALFRGGTYSDQGTPEAVNVGGSGPGEQEWTVRYGDDLTPEQTFEGYQPYLDDRRQTLQSFYQPQLDDQYDNAQDQLKYGLARAGMGASSEAAEGYGDLTNRFDIRQSEMLSKIDQDIYDTRSRFEATRGALEDMLLETGDAARVSNEATTRIDQLYSEQPQVNPLGDVFINAISTYGQYGAGKNQGRVAGIYDQPSITTRANNPSGSGTFIS